MPKTDVVRARIEPQVKKRAERILKRLGISHSTFINMSYRAVVEEGGIPYSLHIPNDETSRALREARDPEKRVAYERVSSSEELIRQLETDDE